MDKNIINQLPALPHSDPRDQRYEPPSSLQVEAHPKQAGFRSNLYYPSVEVRHTMPFADGLERYIGGEATDYNTALQASESAADAFSSHYGARNVKPLVEPYEQYMDTKPRRHAAQSLNKTEWTGWQRLAMLLPLIALVIWFFLLK